MTPTVNAILKKLDCGKIELYRVKGHAYHLFVYDDPEQNIFETHSVMVPFLSSLNVDQWIAEGKHFLQSLKSE